MLRPSIRVSAALLCIPLVLAGCARRAAETAAGPAQPAPTPVARPMPQPPMNAAATLALPPVTANGYVTPNQGLTDAATLWHLRAALNVAVLQCARAGDPMETHYNGFLRTHRAALDKAHSALKAEYRAAHGGDWQDRFDDAMTRLYNFYAQPPARPAFCAAAAPQVAAAAALPGEGLSGFAATALPALDRPFTDFYRAYAAYRADLAAWRAGAAVQRTAVAAAPRLTVDPAVLAGDGRVTVAGRVLIASR